MEIGFVTPRAAKSSPRSMRFGTMRSGYWPVVCAKHGNDASRSRYDDHARTRRPRFVQYSLLVPNGRLSLTTCPNCERQFKQTISSVPAESLVSPISARFTLRSDPKQLLFRCSTSVKKIGPHRSRPAGRFSARRSKFYNQFTTAIYASRDWRVFIRQRFGPGLIGPSHPTPG